MESGGEIPVLVVFGPTASGKTDLAEALFASDQSDSAKNPFRGRVDIVSADSMQVYRGMDIGTAKPDPSLLERLPHLLIDIRSPREQFGAGDFVRLADEACRSSWASARFPVLLGGTAFYLKNFVYGLPDTPEADPATREALRARLSREGPLPLRAELERVDPESARRIHPSDEYRLLRALEVYAASGRPLSSFSLSGSPRAGYRFFVAALERPRDELYARIDRRVDLMFERGLREEFARLWEEGYRADDPGMQAIGYREFFEAASEEGRDPPNADGERVRFLIKRDSRRYAKRQYTFFRSLPGVVWFFADDRDGFLAAVKAFYGAVAT
ncbi:MAG TPA: tRNA (adenosine(37)-N6)-dimethylallyltransferase MiaA [Treponemataceae bacterium]|nr:tRNA (adenosine(37)-N6)-dimethylallyltransferase MiaA [Treponemataceae bacterium]